jgi:Cu/Ag efflux pump CusA
MQIESIAKAARYGLNVADVQAREETALGGRQVPRFGKDERKYPLYPLAQTSAPTWLGSDAS